jgi:hypothetical protein
MRNRRVHLRLAMTTGCLAVCCVSIALRSEAQTLQTLEDPPATHDMMIVGKDKVFLSHLPMFDKESKDHTAFLSPHRYQVILEATLSRGGQEATQIYIADRARNPGVKMYTLNPSSSTSRKVSFLFHPPLTQLARREHPDSDGDDAMGARSILVTAAVSDSAAGFAAIDWRSAPLRLVQREAEATNNNNRN